jgi:DNA invertase Pin-like site-specific DNA recombinase
MKAVNVARVSTEEQREAGNSLPAQTERISSYCDRKGFKVIKSSAI